MEKDREMLSVGNGTANLCMTLPQLGYLSWAYTGQGLPTANHRSRKCSCFTPLLNCWLLVASRGEQLFFSILYSVRSPPDSNG